MAGEEDKSQQTEQPTQKRLDQAHEAGDVVKSQEVNAFILLAGGALAIAMFGKSTMTGIGQLLTIYIEQPELMSVDGAGLISMARGTVLHLATGVGADRGRDDGCRRRRPCAAVAPRLPSGQADAGFLETVAAGGVCRLFGLEGWINLAKGLVKIAIVGMAIWTQLWPARGILEAILIQSPVGVIGDMNLLLFRVLVAALSALGVIAGLDYFFQRMRFIQRNRMSKQEIKEEFRQNEGDPIIKAKVRQIRHERARKRMMAAVPGATVVITNPTHFAVALKYESGKMDAPICVAKGIDALALRIRAIAEENGVPVVENPPLARALHAAVELDEAVPPEHYKAVAEVIGYVLRLSGRMPKR